MRDTVWRSLARASPTFILTFRLRTCGEGMACSCSAADGDISQESDDSQPGPSKKKAKLTRKYQGSALYSTKYQQAWEKEFAFVCPSKSSNYNFHCKACNKDVSVSHQGILDIQRHAESKMHRLRITSLRAQPTLGLWSVSDPVHVSATVAEVRNTVMIAQHNASLCLADHIAPMQRKNFPDSEIAKHYNCARTKTACILNFALAPHLKVTGKRSTHARVRIRTSIQMYAKRSTEFSRQFLSAT